LFTCSNCSEVCIFQILYVSLQVYSANMVALIEEFWDKTSKSFILKFDDEIIKGGLLTHDGKIVNEKLAVKTA